MKRLKKIHPIWATLAFLALLSPFALFSSKLKPSEGNLSPAQWTKEFLYPLEYTFHALHSMISIHSQRIVELNQSSLENIELKDEIKRLKLQQINYDELNQENVQLRKLLSFQTHSSHKASAVQLFAPRKDDIFLALRADKGRINDLGVGMPVVTSKGVLGRIIRTGLYHSDIQLLTDPNFHVDVLIQRTRTRAVLQGGGNGRCILRLHHRTMVKIGDTVVTSGIVGAFPKGLPIGRLTKISYGNDQVSQIIELEPWVNPNNEEYALVLENKDPSIESIVDSTSSSWLESNTSPQSKRARN